MRFHLIFDLLKLPYYCKLQKVGKTGNFELHNFLKLIFNNIQSLCFNFVGCKSFRESNSLDILVLCEANLEDSIDSSNFSVFSQFPVIIKILLLIWMVLQFMWRRDFLLHRMYLENSNDSYLCFWLALLHLLSYF